MKTKNTPESIADGTAPAVVCNDWLAISIEARATIRDLGYFQPTVHPENKEIKGYPQEQGKTYYDSDQLRKMATHFVEIADWLDARAAGALANVTAQPRAERRKEQ